MVRITEREARAVWPGSYLVKDGIMTDLSKLPWGEISWPHPFCVTTFENGVVHLSWNASLVCWRKPDGFWGFMPITVEILDEIIGVMRTIDEFMRKHGGQNG
jgi:hypothetical protein